MVSCPVEVISLRSPSPQSVMKIITLLCLILVGAATAQASHLLGGYIQATPITGSPLTYRISALLYMDEVRGKSAADQADVLEICLGDGSTVKAFRASRLLIENKTTSINSYTLIHTYAGPGVYPLTLVLSNRTVVKNITNADAQLFSLTSVLSTNLVNQTPTPGYPGNGVHVSVGRRATISLAATDPEGDSLVYGLSKAQTSVTQSSCNTQPVSSYQYPNDVTRRGTFKINSRTGELIWDAPTELGYYSVTLTINEYRRGVLISQTTQEIPLVVEDIPGTPGTVPPYESAADGPSATGLVTATTDYEDVNVRLVTFPNPVDDRLQVVIQTSNPTTATLQLTDNNGRKLHELTFHRMARQHEQVISMSSLTPGVYVLRAEIDGRILTRKVVKR